MSAFSWQLGCHRWGATVCFTFLILGLGCCDIQRLEAQVANALASDEVPQPAGEDGFVKEGAWEFNRNTSTYRLKLSLAPKLEPSPSLSVRFLPAVPDLKDGNAAIYYLQAMAGAEQRNARRAQENFETEQVKKARENGKSISDVPPEVWREMAPSALPLEEVRAYLELNDWQRRFLKEAVYRKDCDFDRHIRDTDRPIMYLLPEVQQLRSLARTQKLRFLYALAEDKHDEAIEILGQLYGLGHHMSAEPFLVSNLVGIACAAIGWQDSFYLAEDPATPNLYWAYATLPKPLVAMEESLAFERDILFESFERLREVTMEPKSDRFWQACIDDLAVLMQDLGMEGVPQIGDADDTRLALAAAAAASYPAAMKYLVVEAGMDIDDLKPLSKSHVFFLAMRRNYEITRDEVFKAQYVAYPQRNRIEFEDKLQANTKEYGLVAWPSDMLLPAIHAASAAQARLQQQMALAQTIESIRDFMARNDGKLPQSLNELNLPAPYDPVTGQNFKYELKGNRAILQGAKSHVLTYQFVLSSK